LRATAAGYFVNYFLPTRAGELIRTLMISSQTAIAYILLAQTLSWVLVGFWGSLSMIGQGAWKNQAIAGV
jgi:hypothetical protein